MGADAEHALLSASAAERWGTCGPSLRLHSAFPDSSSKYADEGTAAHTVAAWVLENNADAKDYPHPHVTVAGVDYKVNDEMKASVNAYATVVRKYAEGGTLLVERRVDYSEWIGVPDSFGTSDAIILQDDKIVIVDLKYGMGVKVHAYDEVDGKPQINPQMGLYALGALYAYEHVGDFRKIEAVIVQPRIDHVSGVEIDITDLKIFALKMKAGALRAMKFYESTGDIPLEAFVPSDKGCRWCRAQSTCPALRKEFVEETRDFFGALVPNAENPTPVSEERELPVTAAAIPDDDLAYMMERVPRWESLLSAIRAETERRLLAGHPVPGFKLIEGRQGARKWKDEEAAAKTLRRYLGAKDAMKPLEPISPTAVDDKFYKKGLMTDAQWKKVQALVEQSAGKPSVAPASAPGREISVVSVESRFDALAAPAGADDLV